jgi:hypothetical protein
MEIKKMKYGLFIPLVIALLIQSMNDVRSAEWSLYFQDDSLPLKQQYYIDNGSIRSTPEGTILVWRKSVSTIKNIPKIWIEELREVDCSRYRFKVLQGTVWRPSYRVIEPDDWYFYTPDDMSLAFFETVCGEGNK